MDIKDIKRGLRAEIKKRENEQYATFQCNVRQMCKDVIAKLEELESEITDKDEQVRHQKYRRCLAMAEWCDAEADVADADGDYDDMRWYQKWHERWLELAERFKEEE